MLKTRASPAICVIEDRLNSGATQSASATYQRVDSPSACRHVIPISRDDLSLTDRKAQDAALRYGLCTGCACCLYVLFKSLGGDARIHVA